MSRSRPRPSLEVVATFRGTVLDVRHLRPVHNRASPRTLALGGGVLLAVGLGWLLNQTAGQGAAWAEFQRLAATATAAGGGAPVAPSSGWAGFALAVAFSGVVALALAIVRTGDRDMSSYSIGEGPDAVFAAPPVSLTTPDAFELARLGRTGAAGLRFTPEMTGEITVNGHRYTLRQWARQGWAVAEHGALGTTLPAGARCRVDHGELSFHIAAVGAVVPSIGRSKPDVSFWVMCGGSLLGLGALLVLRLVAAPELGPLALEDAAPTARFVGYAQQPPAQTEPSVDPRPLEPRQVVEPVANLPRLEPSTPSPEAHAAPVARPTAKRRAVTRANSGTSRGDSASPLLALRSVPGAGALMTRGEDPIEQAGRAGLLAAVDTSVFENEHSGAFSPDADDKAMWQAMKDSDVMETSIGGLGLIGKGRGGGPGSTDAMVKSESSAEAAGPERRGVLVRVGRATVRGPRARAGVRGVVLRNVRALRRCYDPQQDDGASVGGRVVLELEIDTRGNVVRASVSSKRSGVATGVTDCMARAARTWSFPVSKGLRRSVVSLPLTLSRG